MAKNLTRTMQGKLIDFEELGLRNENTIAVGNMNVAEDAVETVSNTTVASSTRKSNKTGAKRLNNQPTSTPYMKDSKQAKQYAEENKQTNEIVGLDETTIVKPDSDSGPDRSEKVEEPQALEPKKRLRKKGGLAGAIAKTKEVK